MVDVGNENNESGGGHDLIDEVVACYNICAVFYLCPSGYLDLHQNLTWFHLSLFLSFL